MSEDFEEGRSCARAFLARYKEFRKESLPIVTDDWKMRRIRRRKSRIGRKYRIAFVLAISPFLWKGIECPLILEDYAYLADVRKDKFLAFANKNPAFAKAVLGSEWDKGVRRSPLKDKWTGQVILDRNERISRAEEDIKRGPPASRISFVFQDLEIKQRLGGSAGFAQGFFEELCNGLVSELKDSSPGDNDVVIPFKRMGDELSKIKSEHLGVLFGVWSKLLKETRNGIQGLFERKPSLKNDSVFVSNCNKTATMLTILENETRKDIESIRNDKGTFMTPLFRIVELLPVRHDWNEEELCLVLNKHREEFYESSTVLMRMSVMLYYVSSKATDEFVKYTVFFKPPSG